MRRYSPSLSSRIWRISRDTTRILLQPVRQVGARRGQQPGRCHVVAQGLNAKTDQVAPIPAKKEAPGPEDLLPQQGRRIIQAGQIHIVSPQYLGQSGRCLEARLEALRPIETSIEQHCDIHVGQGSSASGRLRAEQEGEADAWHGVERIMEAPFGVRFHAPSS